MPTPPLPEQPGRTPAPVHSARDEACSRFIVAGHYSNRYNSIMIAAIKDGFNAGWYAAHEAGR